MKTKQRTLQSGDVVQLNEQCDNPLFAGCFMIVTEPKIFGAMGFTQLPGMPGKPCATCVIRGGRGQAFYRARWEEMDYIGKTDIIDIEAETKGEVS